MSEVWTKPKTETEAVFEDDQSFKESSLAVAMDSLSQVISSRNTAQQAPIVDYRGQYDDGRYSRRRQAILGPPCDELRTYLAVDDHEYVRDSPLESPELREMIASTVMSVLPFAKDYTTIIGEDCSGRLPALITGRVLNIVRERQGLEKARQVFVAGTIEGDMTPLFHARSSHDKALLVTEYMSTGKTVKNVINALKRVAFKYIDVVTVDRGLESKNKISPKRLFMGNTNSYLDSVIPYLYDIDPIFRGVTKQGGDAHAKPIALSKDERDIFAASRRDSTYFADKIVAIWDTM